MSKKGLLIIKGGNILTEHGFRQGDVLIQNEVIRKTSEGSLTDSSFEKPGEGIRVIDATGLTIIPSLTDMHVHFREPGFSYKETIKTGSEAAAAGGFTTVCTMPNLNPAPDSMENLQLQLNLIEETAVINVLPFATITKGRGGKELTDYEMLAPYVAGFSDDGSGVQSDEIMREAMKGIAGTGKILSAHCEVESLLNGGYIHKGKYAETHNHKGISSESEWKEVERDIKLSEETGCRLHICHISTKESVELVREAKRKGLPVTCETGPHYLIFSDEDLKEEGRFKMNPPIRGREDREALRKGLVDGTIDVVATDHAPHSEEEKNKGLAKSAMGVTGLETAFAAVYTTMVATGEMTFERLIESMAVNPCKILRLPIRPFLQEGEEASLVILNKDEKFIVDSSKFKSKGHSSPFDGMELQGKIKMTIYKGKIVFDDINKDE